MTVFINNNVVHVAEVTDEKDGQIKPQGQVSTGKFENVKPARATSSHCSCYRHYERVLRQVISKVDGFYLHLTTNICRHPYIWLGACFLLLISTCLGALRFKTESRSDVLFVPENSEAGKALDASKEYFLNMRNERREAVLLMAKNGDNVLTKDCIDEGKQVIREIMQIGKFSELCIKKPSFVHSFSQYDSTHNCSVINPLELVINSTRPLEQINNAFRQHNMLMSNGKLPTYNEAGMFGKITKINSTFIKIGILRVALYIKENNNDESLEWEKKYIETMKEKQKGFKCASLLFTAARSIDDSVTESVAGDTVLVTVSFTLMVSFACAVLGRINNPIRGHFILAIAGVLSTLCGILGGLGLAIGIGTPVVSIVGILLFLVLSIGIDDMFIIVDEFDRQDSKEDANNRVAKTMHHVGATITMTTLTDIIAFAISISSDFPGIRYFSTFAALAFTLEFILQITLFVVFLSFDSKRIKAGRRDCLPCCHGDDKNKDIFGNIAECQASMLNKYSKAVTTMPGKVCVLTLTAMLLASGIYGCLHVSQEFQLQDIVKDGSYFKEYSKVLQNDFTQAFRVNVFNIGVADYSDKNLQDHIFQIPGAAYSTGYYAPHYISWLEQYIKWAKDSKKVTLSRTNFTAILEEFFRVPAFAHFQLDVHLNSRLEIEASRIQVFTKPTRRTTVMREAMLTFRNELKKREIPFTPIVNEFLIFEQYAAVVGEVTRTICTAAAVVLVITLPFCINPGVTFLLLFTFVLLIVELIGLMYFWDVSVNSISMVFLMMSIGFAVDYSAHVAHAFVTSNEETVDNRVRHAITSIGGSVLKGGASTFLGMLVTAFASSEIFRIFFRMFFGIIVFGLFNGLVLLPVLLSLFGRML